MLNVDPLTALAQMRCVMRHEKRGPRAWAARADGCEQYAYGATPEEAMHNAVNILWEQVRRENEAPPARRRIIE